jgi:hypothetical protein
MSQEAARNWCEKIATPYTISNEDFANLIKKYLDRKGKNHRILFMVDEMGQFIGQDSRLMLNLQTLVEDLGTICQGRAWVVVTSQEDIDSITKNMSARSNDFSKIQGRFDTRLSLSSADVGEVIRKRILEKTNPASQTLSLLYDNKAIIIKNLIVFSDTAQKKLYADAKNFAADYPFVPYQFDLLGNVLTAIREHGASGKHLAQGERSMIALFKESAMRLSQEIKLIGDKGIIGRKVLRVYIEFFLGSITKHNKVLNNGRFIVIKERKGLGGRVGFFEDTFPNYFAYIGGRKRKSRIKASLDL